MRRRALIAAVGGALAAPGATVAQPAKMRRIGVLSPFSPDTAKEWHHALEAGLAEAGWTPGRNLAIEYRFADDSGARLDDLAAELVRLNVDLIVSEVTEASWAAKRATSTIPIVVVAVGDPVAAGLVTTLARPGGNVTGLSQNIVESAAKRLELLKLVVPELAEVGVLWTSEDQNSALNWREDQSAAARLGLSARSLEVRAAADLNKVLAGIAGLRGLHTVPGPLFVANLQAIAEAAKAHRVASIFHLPEYARLGGLLAHGPDRRDLFRRAALYVDRILKGARPADLPVEQPTKFGLSINLATARAIGVAIPPLVLAQADEVIE
jgi:putative ABC transport system substrate-binding protein